MNYYNILIGKNIISLDIVTLCGRRQWKAGIDSYNMSISKLSHKELIKLIKDKCIPPLLSKFHKGQSGGRVCIIGGCEDYTGAPYFSANAAALMGCDLTHVICEQNAATVIKSYSPNLMVHPYLIDTGTYKRYYKDSEEDVKVENFNKIKGLLQRIHAVIIGPGLGRDEMMFETIRDIIKYILEEHKGNIPIVLDADGLYYLGQNKEVQELLLKFPAGRVILTPNVVEFKRIYDSVIGDNSDTTDHELQGLKIAQKLKCIVVEKGESDKIFGSNGNMIVNEQAGSNKRVGGQGDTLTGTIGCFLAYCRAMHDFKIMETEEDKHKNKTDHDLEWIDYAMLSCYGGCCVTRECARLAFKENKRAMQTTDLNDRVGQVYDKIFG